MESYNTTSKQHTGNAIGADSVVLSDFDGTLCDTYTYDKKTNNHMPSLRSDVVAAAAAHTLIVATARRAMHPAIPAMWESGLVNPAVPIISENGGVLHLLDENNQHQKIQIAPKNSKEKIVEWINVAKVQERLGYAGLTLALKYGDTMVIMRYQDEDGESVRDDQGVLLSQLEELDPPSWLSLVPSGESVCLQDKSVNKAEGFRAALEYLNIKRSEVHVIGIGDAPNDRAIFEESDESVGVNSAVHPYVNVQRTGGVDATLDVLLENGPRFGSLS